MVAKFAGCDDRDAAEAMVGRELGFDREDYLAPDFPRPPEGLAVPLPRPAGGDHGGRDGGRRWTRCDATRPRCSWSCSASGREVLIPAVAPILRPDAGLDGPLVIDPPAGLLEVADAGVARWR